MNHFAKVSSQPYILTGYFCIPVYQMRSRVEFSRSIYTSPPGDVYMERKLMSSSPHMMNVRNCIILNNMTILGMHGAVIILRLKRSSRIATFAETYDFGNHNLTVTFDIIFTFNVQLDSITIVPVLWGDVGPTNDMICFRYICNVAIQFGRTDNEFGVADLL